MLYQSKRVRDLLYNTHHVYISGFEITERVNPNLKAVQKAAPNVSKDPNKVCVTRHCVPSSNHYAASIAEESYTYTAMSNPGITTRIKADINERWAGYHIDSMLWIYSEAVVPQKGIIVHIHHYIVNNAGYLSCMLVYKQCSMRPIVDYMLYPLNHHSKQDYFNLVRHHVYTYLI